MANRLLLYAPVTLEWRCAAGMMSLIQSLNADLKHSPVPKLVSQLSANQEEALEKWTRLVQKYSQMVMSLQSDKLLAIAALVERSAPILGEYYAGIWQYGIINQLWWREYLTGNQANVAMSIEHHYGFGLCSVVEPRCYLRSRNCAKLAAL